MPQIGFDCEIILDGNGFFIKPNTYTLKQLRVREMKYRADGTLSYVDLGPGRRTWTMTILAINELRRYDGSAVSTTGQQFRDALRSSYTSNIGTTINFTDPLSSSPIPVHFDNYREWATPIVDASIIRPKVLYGGSRTIEDSCKIW